MMIKIDWLIEDDDVAVYLIEHLAWNPTKVTYPVTDDETALSISLEAGGELMIT